MKVDATGGEAQASKSHRTGTETLSLTFKQTQAGLHSENSEQRPLNEEDCVCLYSGFVSERHQGQRGRLTR